MFVNDVFNKEELSALIINELKHLGVKYSKEKKRKFPQEKCGRKHIFRVHLHQLELTDELLTNGSVVQIPSFVAIACQRICEQIETEGLFRKTGSHLRQKEIRVNLENGLPLGKNYHVIDIANVLKTFFRELPEPLLPSHLQEVLLRGFLLAEGKLKAMLLGCMLLPPLTLNTLTFFMQFLKKVSNYSDQNKMTISNLAIIFTPGLMPLNDISSIRFNNHVKIIQLLIQNAESIGVLPNEVASKLTIHTTPIKSAMEQSSLNVTDKKKKKRRSGSLNRMFNGIKKIVGAIGSSSENLENTPENTIPNTPCITKSNKKRKMVDAVSGFSTKKKKEFLNLFPDGNILPNTPMFVKETKKPRISLGGRKTKQISATDNSTSILQSSIERRWSVVGSAWTRKKNNNDVTKKQNLKTLSPVISLPNIPNVDFPKLMLEQQNLSIENDSKESDLMNSHIINEERKAADMIDYVRVPKFEYEAIKERVESIEKRISQEFTFVQKSFILNENSLEINSSTNTAASDIEMSGPEKVLNKFQKTKDNTENIISPTTDQLAKRLSRDLKIRRSAEQRVIRSPSARKIGSIRRRSREAIRLSRNATWHISSTKNSVNSNVNETVMNGISFYPRGATNLKRGRPNTVQTGLYTPSSTMNSNGIEFLKEENKLENSEQFPHDGQLEITNIEKEWVDGALYFHNENLQTPNSKNNSNIFSTPSTRPPRKKSTTPNFSTPLTKIDNETKTPMLPPKTLPRKTGRTPGSGLRASSHKKAPEMNIKKNLFSPLAENNSTGRASIARLRALNAGMVMAKAKLFDDMDHYQVQPILQTIKAFNTPAMENRRQSSRFVINKFEEAVEQNNMKSNRLHQKQRINESSPTNNRTPRRKNNQKSPGCIQKRQRFPQKKYPDAKLLANIVQEQSPATTPISSNENVKHTLIKNMERSIIVRHSPRKSTTPRIKKNLTKINSPRRFGKTSKASEHNSAIANCRTPIRASAAFGLRQSPRLQHKIRINNA